MSGVPRRFALKHSKSIEEPALIVLEFVNPKTEKLFHHKSKIFFDVKESIDAQKEKSLNKLLTRYDSLVDCSKFKKSQLETLLDKIFGRFDLLVPKFDGKTNLNALDNTKLNLVKKVMDQEFNSNRLKPGDDGYQWRVDKEFEAEESCGWDDSESDM
eukprot:TRINITY_DN776112_c0_g1_i1.p1 TRINITY_DN776112_c0_g1~~TRINITY_DN776112_c0_g1_i1.p1  ORF type:complete len:157 (+),score=28.67 TRINITY_DN776112_c0_g1_i1:76-546(+)